MRRLLAGCRLLTLTGVGGVGKSRLVLRAARQCERVFRDGVWLVELAGLTDAALVPAAVARGLGVPDEPPAHMEEALRDHVGRRRLLLVLDNCEHLLAACARLVARLLRECPNAVVLTTSREPLGVEGEVVYPVPPLGLPDPDGEPAGDPTRAEAVTLFVERAKASLPGFHLRPENQEAVFRLCRSLDGIPLAIEMAAVRLRALSLDQIVERLQGQLDLP
ncbi:MAG TPA: AAA family ATPase, partial [Candidatus Dormibacteraeota bacterium]|nr:AAA family ATPase [Candidatus Dormibacteraeota bacterium]